MGNSESGNLDNDDTNWFNNDGDSFTSRHTNRRNQEVEKKSGNEAKYSRSFSALATNQPHTPVSMVSPIMKNFQARSHSAGRASTPVSMVSPIMTKKYPTPSKNHLPHHHAQKSKLANTNTQSTPVVNNTPIQMPSLNQLNTYYHSSFKTKNPSVVSNIQNNPPAQILTQSPQKLAKRSSSMVKPNYSNQNQGFENEIQSKRSQSTPRNNHNQHNYLKQHSHALIKNYYPNYEANLLKNVSPLHQKLQTSQPNVYQNILSQQTPSRDRRERSSSQASPAILNRTYLKKPSESRRVSSNNDKNSNKGDKFQVTPQRFFYPQPNIPTTVQKSVSSSKPSNKNKILASSSKWMVPDLKTNREVKYSKNSNQSIPLQYNHQYGNLLNPVATVKPQLTTNANNPNMSNPDTKKFINYLQYIDLDAKGLGEYKHFVKNILPKYGHAIQPGVKLYNKPSSQMSGSLQLFTNKEISSYKPAQVQIVNHRNYTNPQSYYQNPQFLTSNHNLAVQANLNNYPTNYDTSGIFNNSNPLFSSVYLSGY
jgi:hypothetical protein